MVLTLLELPIDVLVAISDHLLVPDLGRFASLTQTLAETLSHRVEQETSYYERYSKVVYNYDISSPEEKRGLFHILLEILRHPKRGQYVQRLELDDVETSWGRTPNAIEYEKELVRDALEVKNFIERPVDDVFAEICSGDDDAVLCLLIHLLPNLQWIKLPAYCWGGIDAPKTLKVIDRIARLPNQPSASLPLSNLKHIHGCVFNGYYGIDLEGLCFFLSLPSVKTVDAGWVHEDVFTWPEGLPRSRVERIVMRSSTVTRKAIVGLAEGIIGPCKITQDWGFRRHGSPMNLTEDWYELEIPFEGATKEDWIGL